MADRPIIFSAPMIRALLAGWKTQTRRILKPQPDVRTTDVSVSRVFWMGCGPSSSGRGTSQWDRWQRLPYAVGDRLYVRENHYLTDDGDTEYAVCAVDEEEVRKHLASIASLPASFPEEVRRAHLKLRPSIHMPRWASRLTLLVTDVRVERLNDISEADAQAEGVQPICDHGVGNQHLHSIAFEQLWCSLHGDGAWIANPWVVVVSFSVHASNIDEIVPEPV